MPLILLVISFAALALVGTVVARLPRVRRRALVGRLLAALLPAGLVYLGSLLLTLLVADRTGVEIRDSDWHLVRSAAAAPVLPVVLCWGRVRVWAAGSMCVFLGLLGLADVLTLRGLDTLPSVVTLTGASNVWSVRHSIWELLQSADLLMLVLSFGGLVLFALPCPPRASVARSVRTRVVVEAFAWLPLLVCLVGLQPIQERTSDFMDSRFSWKVFRVTDWVRSGVLTAHIYDAFRSAREMAQTDDLSPAELSDVLSFYRARADEVTSAEPAPPTAGFGIARGANVLFVQIEALQQWVIGLRYRGQPVTPFLTRLRDHEAVYFGNVFDQTGSAATTNCEYAVLASQHPLAVGATAFRRPNNDFVALPKVLRRHGYGTYSAHAFHRGYWNRAAFHPSLGFDTSYFQRELGSAPRIGWGLSDQAFFRRALSRLEDQPKPLFGFLVSLTTHHPYKYIPRSKQRLKHLGGLGGVGPYLQSMRYVDGVLEGFFRQLERSPLGENTVVVVYGDHDSRLRFSGGVLARLQKGVGRELREAVALAGHRKWLQDRIPVFVVLPKRARTGRVDTVGGQIDLAPTVLHYLGIERPKAFLGRSLLRGGAGFVARLDGSAATGNMAYQSDGDRCTTLAGAGLPKAKCAALAERAQRELSMSWAVTLNDLHQQL